MLYRRAGNTHTLLKTSPAASGSQPKLNSTPPCRSPGKTRQGTRAKGFGQTVPLMCPAVVKAAVALLMRSLTCGQPLLWGGRHKQCQAAVAGALVQPLQAAGTALYTSAPVRSPDPYPLQHAPTNTHLTPCGTARGGLFCAA